MSNQLKHLRGFNAFLIRANIIFLSSSLNFNFDHAVKNNRKKEISILIPLKEYLDINTFFYYLRH
jgi:hypothetical protein